MIPRACQGAGAYGLVCTNCGRHAPAGSWLPLPDVRRVSTWTLHSLRASSPASDRGGMALSLVISLGEDTHWITLGRRDAADPPRNRPSHGAFQMRASEPDQVVQGPWCQRPCQRIGGRRCLVRGHRTLPATPRRIRSLRRPRRHPGEGFRPRRRLAAQTRRSRPMGGNRAACRARSQMAGAVPRSADAGAVSPPTSGCPSGWRDRHVGLRARRAALQAPGAVLLPAGHGSLVLGLSRGFAAIQTAGTIDRFRC
jgi:hypothetical protein